jgi:Uma2 family endonuclease
MPAETLISVAEYLATSYRPDCDYIDGHIEERNLGEWDHGRVQLKAGAYFLVHQKEWNTYASTEQRIEVRSGRFRVPDVCVTLGNPHEKVLTRPPFLCIEILSPEDRMSRVEQRIADYIAMGVPYVWVLDPETRKAYSATKSTGLTEVMSGVLRTENPTLEMPLGEIFE